MKRASIFRSAIACARAGGISIDGRDAHLVTEIGFFGDVDYERTLTLTEEAAHLEALQRKRQPWIDAAITARDAWFGEKMAA